MKKSRILILLAAMLVVLVLAGCDAGPPDGGGSSPTATTASGTTEPDNLVVAPDQSILSDNRVKIDRVKLAQAGFVVIRSDNNGQPGDTVLGYNRFNAGDFKVTSFVIDVSSLPAGAPSTLWAVIHSDLGQASVFEFPGVDAAINGTDGKPVADSFVLTRP